MGRAKGIIAVGTRNHCQAKGNTIYIFYNNDQNAFTDTHGSANLIRKFHNQPRNI